MTEQDRERFFKWFERGVRALERIAKDLDELTTEVANFRAGTSPDGDTEEQD